MKRLFKKWTQLLPLTPAIVIALATISGFTLSKPELKKVIWPEKPKITVTAKENQKDKKEKEAIGNALTGKAAESALPKKTEPQASLKNSKYKKTDWKDGSYEGSATGFGGPIRVRVTIKDGKITSIVILSHSGETESYFSKAKNIVSHILKKQTPNVDSISGATYSSTGIREAVKNALIKAAVKKGKKTEKTEKNDKETDPQKDGKESDSKVPDGKPADGTYTATADCQQGKRFHYTVEITATFKDGKLTNLSMQTTDSGKNQTYIDKAWSALKNTILSDNTGNVDAVSRATYTSDAIKTAYKEAYKKAVEAGGGNVEEESKTPSSETSTEVSGDSTGESTENPSTEEGGTPSEESTENPSTEEGESSSQSPSEEPEEKEPSYEKKEETPEKPSGPRDGSYSVTATVDADDAKKSNQKGQFNNYKISGTVTFKDGKLEGISNISLISSSVDEEEYEDDEYYTDKAASGMVGKLKSANNADVDTVTGATCSSKAIIKLYKEAYAQAMHED